MHYSAVIKLLSQQNPATSSISLAESSDHSPTLPGDVATDLDGVLTLQVKAGQVHGVPAPTVGGVLGDPLPAVLQQPQHCVLAVVGGSHQQRSQSSLPGSHVKVNYRTTVVHSYAHMHVYTCLNER